MAEHPPRTLCGGAHAPQHFTEHRLPGRGLTLPPPPPLHPAHHLVIGAKSRVACFHDGMGWHLESGQICWVATRGALTLRPAGLLSCEILHWRFQPEALPPALQPMLPPPARGPVFGPAALTPAMSEVIQSLRKSPAGSAFHSFVSTGKLIELLPMLMPGGPETSPPRRELPAMIQKAVDYMQTHLSEPIGLPEIAAAAFASPSHLSRQFTAALGHGPTQHLRELRMEHAAGLLRSGKANVTEAALAVGYASLGQFSRVFQEHHGHPPSALLRQPSAS